MNERLRILVIDDEQQVRDFLKITLGEQGYDVEEASSAREGIETAANLKPDLVLLDLGLPDMDGLEVIKQLRVWYKQPIIILSVREHEQDKVVALDNGADDYLTKPFGMEELFARMRAALRHAGGGQIDPLIVLDDLSIDIVFRRVMVRDCEVKLTPTEYEIIKVLAANAGKVVTRGQLLRSVWGSYYEREVHYLRIYVRHLRQKIEVDPSQPQHIITESGVGYRLL